MTFRRFAVLVGCLGALALFAAPALAEIKWMFQYGSSGCAGGTSCPYGNTLNASSPAPVSVTATALANTYNTANLYIESAYLSTWSGGLGVQNRDGVNMPGSSTDKTDAVEGSSPEHAMDNNQRLEAILFTFDFSVKLTGVEIGWPSSSDTWPSVSNNGSFAGTKIDTDIFVLAYTGSGAPSFTDGSGTPNKAFSTLTSNSWTFVGNYADLAKGSVAAVNGSNTTSMYWLIGTYSDTIGVGSCIDGRSGGANDGCTAGNDAVKLLALYGEKKTNGVPEPNAVLLFGIAVAGIWVTRRRRLA
jgi:hypothetical protein